MANTKFPYFASYHYTVDDKLYFVTKYGENILIGPSKICLGKVKCKDIKPKKEKISRWDIMIIED